MKFNATITDVLPSVVGTSEKGDYTFVPIIVEILEDCRRMDGSVFVKEHEIKVDVCGDLAKDFSLKPGDNILIDIRFGIREYDGKKFQTTRTNYIILR